MPNYCHSLEGAPHFPGILNKAEDPIIYILLYSNIKLKDFILDPKYKKHKVSIGLEKPSKGVELKAKNNSKLEYIETN